ncbi:MAG: hypothetical protein [Caudoviricetes sp.]|nr:MAG: hypothetical protein [Caudoviricetes sp.]
MKVIQFKNSIGKVGNDDEVLSLLGGQISYVGTRTPQKITISYRRNDFNVEIHFGDWIIEKENKEIVILSHDEFLALHSIKLEKPNLKQIIHDAIQKIIRDEKRQGGLLS